MAQARVLCLKQIEKVGCFEILGKYSRSIALALAVGVEKLILAGSRILIMCGQKMFQNVSANLSHGVEFVVCKQSQ